MGAKNGPYHTKSFNYILHKLGVTSFTEKYLTCRIVQFDVSFTIPLFSLSNRNVAREMRKHATLVITLTKLLLSLCTWLTHIKRVHILLSFNVNRFANFGERNRPFDFLLVVFWLWCRCFKCVLLSLWCLGRKVLDNCIGSWSLPSFLLTVSQF